jgi:hypothetical protein
MGRASSFEESLEISTPAAAVELRRAPVTDRPEMASKFETVGLRTDSRNLYACYFKVMP